jgi:UDP:flavonoid glycosyltransferase YjiC (YdhE family)
MRKILFASVPFDGHFNPLTGLAVHLKARGHDVRWYCGASYAGKLEALGVPHLPFQRATEVNGENLTEHHPEYEALGDGPKAIAFALEKIFFGNLEAHLRDVTDARADFPFDAIVFDGAFYAGRLISEVHGARAYPVWPGPTPAPRSREEPPPFFGLRPAGGPLGRLRDRIVSGMLERATRNGMKLFNELRAREGLAPYAGGLFDLHNETSTVMFMWGAPGLHFPRTDWPENMRFIGPLLPHQGARAPLPALLEEKLAALEVRYGGRCVVVSQGTIDNRDANKLFVPALEALTAAAANGSPRPLVVVTTGGRHTAELRRRYPHENVVIEDWIDFSSLLPRASVFITNGGAGSVMHALTSGVPVLAAGKLEGKNDINARLDFRGLGLDLKTERPSAQQIARGVERVLADAHIRENVARVRTELAGYDSAAILERALEEGEAASGMGALRQRAS